MKTFWAQTDLNSKYCTSITFKCPLTNIKTAQYIKETDLLFTVIHKIGSMTRPVDIVLSSYILTTVIVILL